MKPQEVIKRATDMNIWENAVWVNHTELMFFVPIWRNGSTEFMHLAERFGYTLEKNLNLKNYTGYAFVRTPERRIVGQLWRAKENQGFSFDYCIECLQRKSVKDPHLRTQTEFVDKYNIQYFLNLDCLQHTGIIHIDSIIDYMLKLKTNRRSHIENDAYTQITEQLTGKSKQVVEQFYKDDYQLCLPTVGIVGLGKIGNVLKNLLINKHGIQTKGYDIRKDSDSADSVAQSDIIWICVDTPTSGWGDNINEQPEDYSTVNLENALDQFAQPGKIIVIGCTISPGTTRRLNEKYKCTLIYMPFLISQGNVLNGIQESDCWFVGGDCPYQLEILIRKISNSPINFGTWEEAELGKALYNSWIIQKINFANWASDLASGIGNCNAGKVMNWLKSSNKLITSPAYMTPGWGDGGPCHPRDNLMMSWLNTQLSIAYDPAWNNHMVRIMQAKYMAQRAISTELPVIILGKSYKPGVNDTTGSYSMLVASIIRDMGGEVYFEDYTEPGDYCYILAHNEWYGHTPSEKSEIINVW